MSKNLNPTQQLERTERGENNTPSSQKANPQEVPCTGKRSSAAHNTGHRKGGGSLGTPLLCCSVCVLLPLPVACMREEPQAAPVPTNGIWSKMVPAGVAGADRLSPPATLEGLHKMRSSRTPADPVCCRHRVSRLCVTRPLYCYTTIPLYHLWATPDLVPGSEALETAQTARLMSPIRPRLGHC